MAWTQTDLTKIETAIASGVLRVKFQTHEVEYQSVAAMMKARDAIRQEIDAEARPGISYAAYEGGI